MLAILHLVLAAIISLATVTFILKIDHMTFAYTQMWDLNDTESRRSSLPFKAWLANPTMQDQSCLGQSESGARSYLVSEDNCLPPRSDYLRGGSPMLCEMWKELTEEDPSFDGSSAVGVCP